MRSRIVEAHGGVCCVVFKCFLFQSLKGEQAGERMAAPNPGQVGEPSESELDWYQLLQTPLQSRWCLTA